MEERRRLIGERGGETRVGMPKRGNADARDEVEVAAARAVEQAASTSALEDHRVPLVDLEHVLGLERHHVGCRRRHAFISARDTIRVPGALV